MTTSAGTTGYIYDASGNLLIQEDPSSTTLYLSDEEITLAGSTLSGTRYYQLGGQTVAARAGAGAVYYLTGDQEGTQTLAINSATLAVSERFYDSYGSPVGTATGAWPGGQGFQDGTTDSATGLANLGAREYDPGTDSFASPDPLLDPTDPQDLNPYAYAQDSPPDGEDPSGQMPIYQTPTGSYVGTGQSYQTMQDDQESGGYGGAGKTESGGTDGTSPAPVTTPRGCGLFGLGCAVSAAEQGWDDFTRLGAGRLPAGLDPVVRLRSDHPGRGAPPGGHDDRGRNRPARRRPPTRTHPSDRRRRTRR